MDTANYFQNGLAELVEIWHTEVFKFYHLIFFQFYNIICFEDTRLICPHRRHFEHLFSHKNYVRSND
jgi:hypothetical protein